MESQEAATPGTGAVLPSPGAQLRQARERRGESVGEVAFALKLNPRQITALESDDFAALPGMPFVRGFLRNYARYLGLDPVPLLDAVHRLAGDAAVDLSPIKNAEGELPVGAGPRMGAIPFGWIALLLALLVFAGWYFDGFRTESASVERTLETPALSGVNPEPVAVPAPSVAPEPLPPAEEAQPNAAAAGAAPPPAPAEVPVAPAITVPAAAPAPLEAPPAGVAAEASAAPVAPVQPAAGSGQLAFRFAGESWIEVRDASGAIVYSGVNRAGSIRSVQGRAPFALVIGNAASVSLEFNGKPVDLAAHTKVSVARLTVQ